jgi:hypothetical protein
MSFKKASVDFIAMYYNAQIFSKDKSIINLSTRYYLLSGQFLVEKLALGDLT